MIKLFRQHATVKSIAGIVLLLVLFSAIVLTKTFPKCRTIDCSQTGLFLFYDDHENDWI